MQSDTDIETPPDKQDKDKDKQNPPANAEFDDIARAIAHLAGEPMPENIQDTEQNPPVHDTAWAVNEMLSDNPPAEYKVAGRTMLDVLVLEALNPLLQKWLATHLPPMLAKALENELKTRELNAQLTVSKNRS